VSDGQALERDAQLGDPFQSSSLSSREDRTAPRAAHWISLDRADDPRNAAAVNRNQGSLAPLQPEWIGQAWPPLFNRGAQRGERGMGSHLRRVRWGKEF
jgi:hypothetical protein